MTVKLPTEQHLEFLSLTGGCTGSFESIHVKIPHCWKSHVAAQINIGSEYLIFLSISLNISFNDRLIEMVLYTVNL